MWAWRKLLETSKSSSGCHKLCTQHTYVRQQICSARQVSESHISFIMLLLSYIYFDFAFFIGWKLFWFFIYINLLYWLSKQCLTVSSILIKFISFFALSFKIIIFASWNMQVIHTRENTPDFIHRIYDDSKSNLQVDF